MNIYGIVDQVCVLTAKRIVARLAHEKKPSRPIRSAAPWPQSFVL